MFCIFDRRGDFFDTHLEFLSPLLHTQKVELSADPSLAGDTVLSAHLCLFIFVFIVFLLCYFLFHGYIALLFFTREAPQGSRVAKKRVLK